MGESWTLIFDGWESADEGRRETLCTLGNGHFATRGAMPESVADTVHYPGTYAAGVFNRLTDRLGGSLVETESIVNLPNWLYLRFSIEDGPWIELGSPQIRILDHRVHLDLQGSVLHRHLRIEDRRGRRLSVHQRRFVHLTRPYAAALQTVFTAEGWSGSLRVRSAINAEVMNAGVARYRSMGGSHLIPEHTELIGEDSALVVGRTRQSAVRVAQAIRTRVSGQHTLTRTGLREPTLIGHDLRLALPDGVAVTVDKTLALITSRDAAVSEPGTAAIESLADCGDFTQLLAEHQLGWRHLWRRFELELIEGQQPVTDDTLRTLRLCTFHVLQTLSPNNKDLDAGIPARGLHGEAYRGHAFWDELFVFPVLTLRLPGLAKALLHYRIRRLNAARRAAHAAGHIGAMYPWQSGSDGREESQRLHLNPMSGRWLPDVSHLQRHVGLAVAYNIWQYYQATADIDFLVEHGAETLLEIARFWAGAAELDRASNRYRIRGVMGPDEYSTRYPGAQRPGIDDNAYTNIMAVWVLSRAQDMLAVLPTLRRTELVESLNLSPQELVHWQDVSRRMYVPIGADGIIEQFAGYHELQELDWEDYRSRYGDISRLDRILEAEGRSVDEFQASRQADVLMLFYLLSADELRSLLEQLGYALPAEVIPRTIDYYLARTTHGSTLSALVHAWVLARANREHALEHFERAFHSDIADIQGGTTAEGIHIGAMAGCIDLLQRCFAGIETRLDALWLNPHWPRQFGRLHMTVQYRGQLLSIQVAGRQVSVAAEPGPGDAIRVGCGDQVRTLQPGDRVEFTAAVADYPADRKNRTDPTSGIESLASVRATPTI